MNIKVSGNTKEKIPEIGELFTYTDCFETGDFEVFIRTDHKACRKDRFTAVALSNKFPGRTLNHHVEGNYTVLEQKNTLELAPKE